MQPVALAEPSAQEMTTKLQKASPADEQSIFLPSLINCILTLTSARMPLVRSESTLSKQPPHHIRSNCTLPPPSTQRKKKTRIRWGDGGKDALRESLSKRRRQREVEALGQTPRY